MAAAAVVTAAVVDAVRRDEEPAPLTETGAGELEGRDELAAALASLGAQGELRLREGTCSETILSLPSLDPRPSNGRCDPAGASSPDGLLVARCVEGGVEVFHASDGGLERLVPGCAPAWRPDGVLTAALRDEVVRFRVFPCASQEPCAVPLIPRAELERAARRHPTVPDRIARVRALVEGIAWLTPARAAVAISIRLGGRFERLGPLSEIAFFEGGRLDGTRPYFRATGGRLAASPRGTYVTRTPDVILRGDGSQVELPQHLRVANDFAWSPDERFVALAGRFAVTVVDVASLERYDETGGGLRSVTIPQAAARLAWR